MRGNLCLKRFTTRFLQKTFLFLISLHNPLFPNVPAVPQSLSKMSTDDKDSKNDLRDF